MDSSAKEGQWQVKKRAGLGRYERAQIEAFERKVLREWEATQGHWSGVGKHTSEHDFTDAKRVHRQFELAADKDLGSGSFGKVEKVHFYHNSRASPVPYVCLARKYIGFRRKRTIRMLREEAKIMERIDRHEHIVKLVGTYALRSNELYILLWPAAACNLDRLLNDIDMLRAGHGDRADMVRRLEALELGDLTMLETRLHTASHGPAPPPSMHSATTATASLPPEQQCPIRFLQRITGCLARAVAYCHSKEARHMDIKPENILINPRRVYLADFNVARDVADQDHTRTMGGGGTPRWRPPEMSFTDRMFSPQKADVYSLGLVFLAIASVCYGCPLADFDDAIEDLTSDERADKLHTFHTRLSKLAVQANDVADPAAPTFGPRHILGLTARMLDSEDSKRPTAKETDDELVALGGIDQIYHGTTCGCQRSRAEVTASMDLRLKKIVAERDQMDGENTRMAKRVRELEAKDETYELRIQSVRKAQADGNALLQERLRLETQRRGKAEQALLEAQNMLQRQQQDQGSSYVHLARRPGGHLGPARTASERIRMTGHGSRSPAGGFVSRIDRPRTHPLTHGLAATPASLGPSALAAGRSLIPSPSPTPCPPSPRIPVAVSAASGVVAATVATTAAPAGRLSYSAAASSHLRQVPAAVATIRPAAIAAGYADSPLAGVTTTPSSPAAQPPAATLAATTPDTAATAPTRTQIPTPVDSPSPKPSSAMQFGQPMRRVTSMTMSRLPRPTRPGTPSTCTRDTTLTNSTQVSSAESTFSSSHVELGGSLSSMSERPSPAVAYTALAAGFAPGGRGLGAERAGIVFGRESSDESSGEEEEERPARDRTIAPRRREQGGVERGNEMAHEGKEESSIGLGVSFGWGGLPATAERPGSSGTIYSAGPVGSLAATIKDNSTAAAAAAAAAAGPALRPLGSVPSGSAMSSPRQGRAIPIIFGGLGTDLDALPTLPGEAAEPAAAVAAENSTAIQNKNNHNSRRTSAPGIPAQVTKFPPGLRTEPSWADVAARRC